MTTTRRTLIAATAGLLAAPALLRPAYADGDDARLIPRDAGDPKAKTQVEEWFSFTCPHCARFAADVYPQIKAKLIDTGKVHYVFREFPRDRLDLAAACVARTLPASRYEPFMMALLASQRAWAFDRAVVPLDELAKRAALAGMPRDVFDRAVNDDALKDAILNAQSDAEKKYNIDSTPTFIVNGKPLIGEQTYAAFAAAAG